MQAHCKVAVAAKDLMSARVLAPIVKELSVGGAKVELFLEGLAAGSNPFEAEVLFTAEKGARLEPGLAREALRRFGPHVLLVGSSTSDQGIDSIERVLLKEAQTMPLRVKTVCAPDYWGAERRLNTAVDLALVIDEEAARMSNNLASAERIAIIGDVVSTDVAAQDAIARERIGGIADPDRVLLLSGQGREYLPDLMRLGIECLKRSPGWRIVPRLFHPKKSPDPECARIWDDLSAQYRREGRILDLEEARFPIDALAVAAGATLSGFSTLLRYAALAGKLSLAGDTQAIRLGRERSTGCADYPPALRGEALAIAHGVDLNRVRTSHARLRPFNPRYAASRIFALIA